MIESNVDSKKLQQRAFWISFALLFVVGTTIAAVSLDQDLEIGIVGFSMLKASLALLLWRYMIRCTGWHSIVVAGLCLILFVQSYFATRVSALDSNWFCFPIRVVGQIVWSMFWLFVCVDLLRFSLGFIMRQRQQQKSTKFVELKEDTTELNESTTITTTTTSSRRKLVLGVFLVACFWAAIDLTSICYGGTAKFRSLGIANGASVIDELIQQRLLAVNTKALASLRIGAVDWPQPSDANYYLKTAPATESLLFVPAPLRVYDVYFNPRLFNTSFGPSALALRSIVAHELTHVVMYRSLTMYEFVFGFLLDYADYHNLIRIERATDLELLNSNLDLAQGLIAYREWIYSKLDNDGIEAKMREYMTPDEIREFVRTHRKV